MGPVIVDVRVRGSKGEVTLRALVDTGFYGDVITVPEKVYYIGMDFKYRRRRRLPDGGVVEVRYGGGEIG